MDRFNDIFDYVQIKENAYKNNPISVYEDWEWSMSEHLKTSAFYKFGRLLTGNSDDKPVKNITRPILNLRYRAEDIGVKDVNIYANDPEKYHLSLIIKKYHDEVFAKENNLDTFFDEAKEEKIDFGGSLVEKTGSARPVMVPLQSIAFCDQSDIMGSPFGIKLSMNPASLRKMAKKGWGKSENGATISVEELISAAMYEKNKDRTLEQANQTPGKYVDIYKVWGVLPAEFAGGEEGDYTLQLHFITFLNDKEGNKTGLSLFSVEDPDEDRFKFVNGDEIYGRALGFGGVEELFEAQVWTNYAQIRKKDMLDAASKILMQTDDANLASRHPSGLKDLDNLELLELEEGKKVGQIDTFPRNYQLFSASVNEWEDYAQRTSSASDSLLGEEPKSGTPFRLQESIVREGKGIHQYRRGKYARFIEEVYRDWIIPHIAKEVTKGTKFLANLSQDELELVSTNVAKNAAEKIVKDRLLSGKLTTPEEKEAFRAKTKADFQAKGNKRFLELLKGELKNIELKVFVDVAGEGKDLASTVDKLTNVFRQVFANPAILQDPRAAKLLNKIMEFSGLSQVDFGSLDAAPQPQQQAEQQGPEALPASQSEKPITQ